MKWKTYCEGENALYVIDHRCNHKWLLDLFELSNLQEKSKTFFDEWTHLGAGVTVPCFSMYGMYLFM